MGEVAGQDSDNDAAVVVAIPHAVHETARFLDRRSLTSRSSRTTNWKSWPKAIGRGLRIARSWGRRADKGGSAMPSGSVRTSDWEGANAIARSALVSCRGVLTSDPSRLRSSISGMQKTRIVDTIPRVATRQI